MSSVYALAFNRASGHRATAANWMKTDARAGGLLGEMLPGWSSQTDLVLEQAVEIDVDGLREDCGLDEDAPLRVLATWRSDHTFARGASDGIDLPPSGELRRALHLEVPGRDAGGTLWLDTRIILSRSIPRKPLSPWQAGTIVWNREYSTRLEGSASRFPMSLVDFGKLGGLIATDAPWHLELDVDSLEAPVLGRLRLMLNSGHAAVRMMTDEPSADRSRALLSMMRFDVARTLITAALRSPEFRQRQDSWPRNSIGQTMARLVHATLRNDTLERFDTMLDNDPARFESELKHRLKFLGDLS